MVFLKNKRVILAAAALLVAAGIFGAVKLLWREDAREFYFKAESGNFKKYSQWLSKTHALFQEKQKPYKTTPYQRRLELTAEISSGGKPFGMEKAERLYDLIKRSKLVIDTERQPLDDTAVSDITLLLERVPFIDTTAYTKAGKLYFTIPVLMPEKYFSVDIGSMDEVYDRFSLPVRPGRLVNAADIAQAVEFDEPSFQESAAKLGKVFSGLIGEEDVRFGEAKELAISGGTVKGREVLVTLDAPAATELIHGLLEAAASDDALLSFTYGNFADLSTMLDDAGLFRLFGYLDQTGTVVLSEEEKELAALLNVRKNTDGFKNAIRSLFDGHFVKNGIEMAVIIDQDGNILDRKLSLDIMDEDGSASVKADIHTGSSNAVFEDCRNRFAIVKLTYADGSAAEFSLIPAFDKASGTDEKGRISLGYAVTPKGGGKTGMDVELDISGITEESTLKRNDTVRFQVKMYSGGEGGSRMGGSVNAPAGDENSGNGGDSSGIDGSLQSNGAINGEWSRVSWSNKKRNTTSYTAKLSVNADLPAFGVKDLSAVVNLACEDRMGIEQVVLPEVRQDRITDLNTVTEAELDRIRMEAAASFGTFYLTNKPVFDAILGK